MNFFEQSNRLFIFIIGIYLVGFGIDVMNIDAGQYASMSREMANTGKYLHVYDLGNDYLDKPPFLFWISALSMKIFGVNNFAYRLPSFLFALLSIFSTYKLAALFYDRKIATLSALILASCQALFLITHDVRTDTILMGFAAFSLWQLAVFFQTNSLFHLLLGCAGIAGGLMTKGPIALIVPVFSFGSHFILKKNFRMFFRWQYLPGLVLIVILLLPMCIGLYQQFDMHPEKLVNNKTHVSGLRFFFWTQSFGRITGESDWNNNSNIFFLLQNMLWAFLPWIIFFVIAFFIEVKQIFQQRFRLLPDQEWITTGGFLLTYLSLGISKYQLPHYIFVVFPLAAIITGKFIYDLAVQNKFPKTCKYLFNVHKVIFLLVWIILLVLLFYCFNTISVYLLIAAGVLFICYVYVAFFRKKSSLLTLCLFTILSINFFMNSSFYPSLLQYQMDGSVGRKIREEIIPSSRIFLYQYNYAWALHFYANKTIEHKDSLQQILPGDWLLLEEKKLKDFDTGKISYQIMDRGYDFHVSMLSIKFLNPATRSKELTPYVIIQVN